jgi:hypothetical protein
MRRRRTTTVVNDSINANSSSSSSSTPIYCKCGSVIILHPNQSKISQNNLCGNNVSTSKIFQKTVAVFPTSKINKCVGLDTAIPL